MNKPKNQINIIDRVPLNLALIFIALSLGIILLGIYYYNSQKEDIITQQERELTTISDYKAKQIETWLDDRIKHANSILVNKYRIEQIRLFLKNPETSIQKENLLEWFQYLCKLYKYENVTLFNGSYEQLISEPSDGKFNCKNKIESIRKNEPIKEVKISDLYQCDTASPVHIDIFIPVKYSENGIDELTAVLVFYVDVQSFIFPTLLEIPTRYNTMESLIAQKKDDYVLFLNDLKFKQQTALKFKIPLTEKDIIAVQASEGKEGITYGNDYRNKEVLAHINRISINGTSWFLITKIDMDEIKAPILRRTSIIFLIVLFGIVLTGIIISLIWRHQRANHYRLLYQKEVESRAMAEHYAYLSRYANDIILLEDKDLNIIEANDKALESYGYTKEEFLMLNVSDLRIPEFVEGIKNAVEQIKKHGGIVFETEHKRKDGSRFPVEVSKRLIDVDEKIFYQCIIRDISERKKNEKIIKENEILTNAVIQNSPVGITIRNVGGELIEYNKAWMDIWGLDDKKVKELEENSKNKSADERYGYFGKYIKNVKNAFEKGESCFIPEIKIENPYNGKEIFLSIYLYALKSNGKTERIVSLTSDITEQKKAEERLKESEEKHRSIIEHSTILFYSHTPDHILTYISPQTKEYFDCEPEEALVNWTNLATDNPVNELGFYLTKKAIETGEAQPPYELELKGKKERIIWVEVYESPVVVNGKTVAIIGSLTDITARKKTEEKIYRLNRTYRVISEINQAIVRNNNKDELFSQICQILIDYGKLKMNWIAEIDLSAKEMKPLAVSGDTGNYLKVLLANKLEILKENALLPKALTEYKVKAYNDSSKNNNLYSSWRNEFIKQGFSSYCFVPLKKDSEKYTVLNIYSSDTDFFDDDEIKLLNELAADISYALDRFETENLRKIAVDALNKTTGRLKLLFDASIKLSKSLDLNVIYTEIYKFISGTMECDSFIVSNFDSKEKLIKCSAAWFEGKRADVSAFPPIQLEVEGKGTQSRVIQSGKSLIINDYLKAVKDNKTSYHIDTKGGIHTHIPNDAVRTRSALVVPLKIEDKVIGVVQVFSYKENAFSPDDLNLFESLTLHVSSAIHNAILYQLSQDEIKERKRTLEELKIADKKISKLNRLYIVLSQINQSIVRIKEKNELFEQMCEILVKHGYFNMAWIAEVNFKENKITLLAVKGDTGNYTDTLLSHSETILNDDNYFVKALRDNEIKVVNESNIDYTKPWRKKYIEQNFKSHCFVPVKRNDEEYIILSIYSAEPYIFDSEEVKLLYELSTDISFALDNFEQENQRVKAEDALKHSKGQLQILYETSENLNHSLNLEDTYHVIIDFVSKFMDCEGLIVSEYNSKEQKIYYKAAWIQGVWTETDNIPPIDLAPEGKGILSRVIRSEKSLIINDYMEELKKSKTKFRVDEEGKTYDIDSDRKDNTRSALMVPLKIEGKVIGVLHVISFRENAYTEEHQKLLESISVHISSAINNATLYRLAREEIIERKRTEEELRRSEERFSLAFKLSPIPMSLTKLKDGTFIDMNDAYVKLLGFKHDEVLGIKTTEVNIWDNDTRKKTISRLKDTGLIKDMEIKIRNKESKEIDTLTTLQIINISGEDCIIAMVQDITEKKKSEEQLRKLSSAVGQSPASIIITGTDGNIEYVNSKFTEVTGYTYREVKDKNPSIIKSGETPDEVYKELWQTITSGSEWHGELYNKKKNGELFWEWASISPILDSAGKVTNYLAVKEDITVQKMIRQQIQFQAILMENISDAIIYADKNHVIKSWNRAAEELYGWKAEEILEKKGPDLLRSQFIDADQDSVLETMRTKGNWTGELIEYKKDGKPINIFASYSYVRGNDGKITGYLSVNRDITMLKDSEEKIKASLKEKEILLKEIHHRVKNNLQVISSLLKMQAGYISDPVSLEYFKISSQRVKSMALIHEQLYRSADLSKIDFYTYVKKLATHLYQTYGMNMGVVKLNVNIINIKLSIDTAIPCGLLINELISNSLKHGFPEGGKGRIEIEMKKEGSMYVLSIKDTGVGFPSNIDFRNTETLGMQLINTLTEQIDGQIELIRDSGSEFIITFKADEYKERI